MTPIIMTEITGIEIPKVKVILIGAEDGIIVEVRDIVIGEEGEDGTLISNIMTQGTKNRHSLQTRIIIAHHLWDINTDTQSHMSNTHILSNNNTHLKCLPAPSRQATNICQLCQSQGHYDYQCQFAGDFMARTQKAFNQGRSYNHQDPNQGEWSNGDTDNNDPNGQPFQ